MRIQLPGAIGANWFEDLLYWRRCASFMAFLSRGTPTTSCGFNIERSIGSDVLYPRLNGSCAGDALYPSRTLFRNANCILLQSSNAFFIRFFTVPMVRSACTLLCGYRGLLLTWSMSHNCVNVRNSLHENWGPLSETNTSGEPLRANCDRIASMSHDARVFEPSRASSKKSE